MKEHQPLPFNPDNRSLGHIVGEYINSQAITENSSSEKADDSQVLSNNSGNLNASNPVSPDHTDAELLEAKVRALGAHRIIYEL